jgi:hypothetical protein
MPLRATEGGCLTCGNVRNNFVGPGAARGGKREDLNNRYFRSAWEANYARYLNLLIKTGQLTSWGFEERTFQFPVKRGGRLYTPDFRLTFPNGRIEYHEIKGYMSPRDATKIKRLKKYYPEITLVLIEQDQYHAITRQIAALIPEWEFPKKHSGEAYRFQRSYGPSTRRG